MIRPNFDYFKRKLNSSTTNLNPTPSVQSFNQNGAGFAFHLGQFQDYSGFTGQHYTITDDIYVPGMIVESTGEYFSIDNYEKITLNASWCKTKVSTKKQSKKVFGVVSHKIKKCMIDYKEQYEIKLQGSPMSVYFDAKKNEQMYSINSVGEGAIFVCSEGGMIENGDYICSSNVPGIGMKQSDDILHNYTVAKATCDCNFFESSDEFKNDEITYNGQRYKIYLIGCTYHCG
jgi:hypothetical protein